MGAVGRQGVRGRGLIATGARCRSDDRATRTDTSSYEVVQSVAPLGADEEVQWSPVKTVFVAGALVGTVLFEALSRFNPQCVLGWSYLLAIP